MNTARRSGKRVNWRKAPCAALRMISPGGPRPPAASALSTSHRTSARRLAVSDARLALPDFYNVAVGIADVAARLAILFLRLRNELGSATPPQIVARMNIRNADIHETA